MEGESSTPHPVIIYLMIACLAYVDYGKLFRCFVGIDFRIHTNQFMWKRNIIFFSVWLSVIAALLGRLIDLMIIIPWKVPLNETPVYSSFLREWFYGVVALLIWSYLGKIERIKREGIDRLPLNWLFGSVIGSAIQTLLASLIVPYVVSLFLGAFGAAYATQRLVWPAFFVMIVICIVCRLFVRLVIYVREVEYDRLYCIGYKVMNYDSDTDSFVWGCD
ncbi:hypothetical protein HA466_0128100 [Hirschfeldia incana]|nr:hypothetical protein HA466_0128100 [Hirschfeldia incana]